LVVEDDDFQIWRITAKIMKQSWTADEGWPSTLATGQMASNSSHYKMLHRPSNADRFFELAARLPSFEKLRTRKLQRQSVASTNARFTAQPITSGVVPGFNGINDEECLLTHNTVLNGN